MGDEISGDVDLFGEPVIYRDTRAGRPEHARTLENASKVSLLFACGYAVKDVAAALGITQPTLRKHYFHELGQRRVAGLKMKALQLARLNAEADKGNVSAEKALFAIIEREQVKQYSDRMAGRADTPERKPRPLGKKEEQKNAAHGVTGKFAPPDAPLLN